jgi:hypothetical protein
MNLTKNMRKTLKSILESIVSRFTMKYERVLFWDKVSGNCVNLYVDKFGVEWMATNKFGYRVKR